MDELNRFIAMIFAPGALAASGGIGLLYGVLVIIKAVKNAFRFRG
jgi:hypothetical protein